MQELPLNAYLEDYYRGNLDKKKLEGLIFEFILQNSKLFHLTRWEKEDCVDYLCWLYPRLSRAIDTYQAEGSSFDAYIGAMVRLSIREYRIQERDHAIAERAYWDNFAEDMAAAPREPEYAESIPPLKPITNPRQALVLVLKSYYFVSEDFISRIAPALGIPMETLIRMIDTLRNLQLRRDQGIQHLRERLYTQYYRSIAFEKRMRASVPGSPPYEQLKNRLERAKKRLAKLRNQFKSIRAVASNRQIAQVLGIPKGTVDSNLYAVKERHHSLEKRCLNPGKEVSKN